MNKLSKNNYIKSRCLQKHFKTETLFSLPPHQRLLGERKQSHIRVTILLPFSNLLFGRVRPRHAVNQFSRCALFFDTVFKLYHSPMVMSEAASSTARFDMLSATLLLSSPFCDAASSADTSEASATDSACSELPAGCCRLQYMMLAVRVKIIFWFTCHKANHALLRI